MRTYILIISLLFFLLSSCNTTKKNIYTTKYNVVVKDKNTINFLKKRLDTYAEKSGMKIISEVTSKMISINFQGLIAKKTIENLFDLHGEIKIKGKEQFLDIKNNVKIKALKSQKYDMFSIESLVFVFKDKNRIEKFSKNNIHKKINFIIGDSTIMRPIMRHKITNGILGQTFGAFSNLDPFVILSVIKNPYSRQPKITYSKYEVKFNNQLISEETFKKFKELKETRQLMHKINNYKDKHREFYPYPAALTQVSRFLNETSLKDLITFIKTSSFKSTTELELFVDELHLELNKYKQFSISSYEKAKDIENFEKKSIERDVFMKIRIDALYNNVKIYYKNLED